LIYGMHAVSAVLSRDPGRLIEVLALRGRQDDRLSALINEVRRENIKIEFLQRKELDHKARGGSHQGIIARVKPGRAYTEDDLDALLQNVKSPFLLILDGVTDPHNLGACMRSADAAGVDAVIIPKDKSASLSPTTRKAACGAAEALPLITVTNLVRTIQQLKEKRIWVVGTAGEAEQTVFEAKLTGAIAFVMGSEDKGLHRLTRENCDALVKIPMAGSVSSLNVSVACGICLFEAKRGRESL